MLAREEQAIADCDQLVKDFRQEAIEVAGLTWARVIRLHRQEIKAAKATRAVLKQEQEEADRRYRQEAEA